MIARDIFYDDLEVGFNPWANAREKSAAAMHREDDARSKFDYLASQMNMAIIENTKVMIGLGCQPKSESPLKVLSSDLVDHIMGYVGLEPPSDPRIAMERSGLGIIPYEGWQRLRTGGLDHDTGGVDLANLNLFQPGKKIIIPFSKPNHHLTQPCYRDLHQYIKRHTGWDIRRVAATPMQKIEYNEQRKGKVYFTNVTYAVPGCPARKKRARKLDPVPEPLSPIVQNAATSALDNAVSSAEVNGIVDPVCLQDAMNVGYSKHFILGRAAERWESLKDTKPPAKKSRRRKH